jgi:superfamily II DNA or RNA helicase
MPPEKQRKGQCRTTSLLGLPDPDRGTAPAAAVEEWRQDWRRNLLLVGPVGTGKTHAAIAAARLAHFRGHRVVAQ